MTAWREQAAAWLRAKADEQEAINHEYPRHAEAYTSWESRVRDRRRLADELLAAPTAPTGAQAEPVAADTLTDADYNEAMARVLAAEKRGSPAVQLSVALLRRIIAAASASPARAIPEQAAPKAEPLALKLADYLVKEMPHTFINRDSRNLIANVLMECLATRDAQGQAAQPVAAEGVTDTQRLAWLHSPNKDAEGYEYGVAKVKFADNGTVSFLWTYSDHSDIDPLIRAALSGSAESKKGEGQP